MRQPCAKPRKGLQPGNRNGLYASPKEPTVPTMGTIGLIGNLGGRVGKNKGDVTGLRKGATGPRPRKETAGFMGRLMVGGRVIIGATAGRLMLGAGGRTIGGCGARTT